MSWGKLALREASVYLFCTSSWVYSVWDSNWTKTSFPREVFNLLCPEMCLNRSTEGLQPLLVPRRCGVETWTSYTWERRANECTVGVQTGVVSVIFLIACFWVHILLQVVMTTLFVWHSVVLMPSEHALSARLLQLRKTQHWWASMVNSCSVYQHSLRHGCTQKWWGISMQGLIVADMPSTERINILLGSSRLGKYKNSFIPRSQPSSSSTQGGTLTGS